MADPQLPFGHPLAAMRDGYYGMLDRGRPKDLPYRPPDQEVARIPPPRNLYVDQLNDGTARLVDDKGNTTDVPATSGMREGHMMDGSLPNDGGEAARIRARLSAGDDGVSTISLDQHGAPKVPLAPGSPGPPIPPAADSMIGQKKRSSQTKRRPIP